MNYPVYPEYKDSGIEWLGEVPAEWTLTRMDKHLSFSKIQVTVDQMAGQDVFHYSIPNVQSLGTGEVEAGDTIDSNKLRVNDELILVSKLNPRKGTVCVAAPREELTVCSTEFVPIRARGLDNSFLFYIVSCDLYRQRLESSVASVTRSHQRIDPSEVYRFWWAVPKISEQQLIADFLDRETAKIDALIAKQEQLIATLREDRTATITQAVTKGLDSNVEMRDTGVGWLGQIPTPWKLLKLRHLGRPIIGLTYSPDDVTDESETSTLILRSANIQDGRLSLSDRVYVGCSIPPELTLQEGDILLCSRNGSRALIGKNIRIDESVAGQSFGAFMTVFRSEFNEFLYWVFNSKLFEYQMATFLSSTINQLTTGNLKSMEVPLPPMAEQQAIAAFLNSHCARVDALIAKSVETIGTLREYRSALITAAVTGKIDVRKVA